MDQNNAQNGQEAMPVHDQSAEPSPEERPTNVVASMESLLSEEGLTLDFPKQGEIRTGVIASIGDNEIMVSVGTKSEGVISGREKEQIPVETLDTFQVGMEIPVYVLNPEDQNGTLVLSYIRAREEQDWELVEDLMRSGDAYDGVIIGYNKGGLIVPVGTLRGFVPASQVSVMRRPEGGQDASPDTRWSKMVNEPIKVQVIEVDRARHRLILSERSALQETRETIKDRLLDELEEGSARTGRVTSLADFGAFVNIDGADGLVHLSEISWDRIEHPNEVLRVGQEVKVKIIAVDQERKRIGLSIRQLLPDPWLVKVEHLKEGQLVEGTITHLTKFGAFARLDNELEGLIHISELSENRINHPKEVVKEGDVVALRVIRIDAERRRIGLSKRKVDSPAYLDMDWKMELASEIGEASLTTTPEESVGAAEVVEAQPIEAEPQAELQEAEPQAELQEAEPQAELQEAEPQAELQEAEPQAELQEAEPQAELQEAEPQAELQEAEPQAELQEAEPQAELQEDAPAAEEETPAE
ncbi:MAG: S1 RNA-binding domain-containing protein [Anaerolineales bacterium]|nr:S1 RNA-binding domain-containing protein [Anaerolineales bacterium]